ncbi:hypothetical protein VNO78_21798 [Psophocarpus tetragonolobus]|uniref:Uncharacterized protein n=1 Tax=Psophocarpus tetragonolobus TaxID=3891 RepID=A0AAN9SBM9_PSOTE
MRIGFLGGGGGGGRCLYTFGAEPVLVNSASFGGVKMSVRDVKRFWLVYSFFFLGKFPMITDDMFFGLLPLVHVLNATT